MNNANLGLDDEAKTLLDMHDLLFYQDSVGRFRVIAEATVRLMYDVLNSEIVIVEDKRSNLRKLAEDIKRRL